MVSVALSAVALLAAGVGVTLAIVAKRRADKMLAETTELIRSKFGVAGTVDPAAIRDVGMVRYDALEEMAGQLSFSVALLNAAGDGLVLTSINGRSETRTYAKIISGGQAMQPLSPEEEQAIRTARRGPAPSAARRGTPPQDGGKLIITAADRGA